MQIPFPLRPKRPAVQLLIILYHRIMILSIMIYEVKKAILSAFNISVTHLLQSYTLSTTSLAVVVTLSDSCAILPSEVSISTEAFWTFEEKACTFSVCCIGALFMYALTDARFYALISVTPSIT